MALSNEIISQFAKLTKTEKPTDSEKTVYGTIVERDGSKYVKLDGSDLLTPVSSTTNIDANERVTVMIKNHTATITGNLSSPAARGSDVSEIGSKISDFEIIITDKVDTKELVAVEGRIEDLEADNVEINETLKANKASIEELETTKLSAETADLKYANIDFSNIGKATMEYFYSTSGLIKNVVVGDQTITGNLVGVTISGDLIEGNTVVAEKLVIKGTDGLYYKLNTDGMNIEAQQTDYNSLNGSIIKAKSITATKISVDDLVAFDATIGGFNITDNSLYSGVKESIDNTTRGIYLDKTGQVVFGDSTNYIKYFKDVDGIYKLNIVADEILFASTGKTITETVLDASGLQMTLSFDPCNAIETDKQTITVTAHVWKNGIEITDDFPAKAFVWERNSGDATADSKWAVDADHVNTKEIILTRDDVKKSSLISCQLSLIDFVEDEYLLTDSVTGFVYSLYVSNGKLHMSLADGLVPGVAEYLLSDTIANAIYSLYVSNGKLHMSQTDGSMSGAAEYLLSDTSTNVIYSLYVSNGKLSMGRASSIYDTPDTSISATVFDHSVVETSHVMIKDSLIDIHSGGALQIESGGTMNLKSGSNMTVEADSDIEMKAGSKIKMGSGSDITIESGGKLDMLSGSDINVNSGGNINLKTGANLNVASGGDIHLASGGTFTADSENFTIDKDGNVTVKGTVSSGAGDIGGWNIESGALSSGSDANTVALSTADPTYGIWAGAEASENAPFRVAKDGSVFLTKLYVTDENGVANPTPANLNASYWKMDKAYSRAVKSMSVSDNVLTITLYDGTSINFKKADTNASVGTSGSGYVFPVDSSGERIGTNYATVSVSADSVELGDYTSANSIPVWFDIMLQGAALILRDFITIDATGVYNSGWNACRNNMTAIDCIIPTSQVVGELFYSNGQSAGTGFYRGTPTTLYSKPAAK